MHRAPGAGQLNYVGWKERKQVAQGLKYLHTTEDEAAGNGRLGRSDGIQNTQPSRRCRQRNWERMIPFFQFPAEVRKVIYTTKMMNR